LAAATCAASVVIVLSIAPSAVGAGSPAQRAIVRAINLRAADVPGFTPHSGTAAAALPFGAQINATCSGLAGASKHPRAAHASSPLFLRSSGLHGEYAQSDVAVERSRRVVTHDLSVARSKHTRVCLKQILQGLTIPEQGTTFRITGARVTVLHPTVAGADGSFGIRLRAAITGLSVRIPISVDVLGFAVGRDEITLTTGGVERTFPSSTQEQLARLLVSRALALPH
jgi:hypothetical protein